MYAYASIYTDDRDLRAELHRRCADCFVFIIYYNYRQSRSLVQTVAEMIKGCKDRGELLNQPLLNKVAELNKKSRDAYNFPYQ